MKSSAPRRNADNRVCERCRADKSVCLTRATPSTSYGTIHRRARFARACCKAPQHRVSAGRACIFYAPDLIFIHERSAALNRVQLYIGDGATVTQSFIRKRDKALIAHSAARTQLTWCQKEGVPRAIIISQAISLIQNTNVVANIYTDSYCYGDSNALPVASEWLQARLTIFVVPRGRQLLLPFRCHRDRDRCGRSPSWARHR